MPSSSQTSGGKVTNMTGQRLIGANARVDAAPARNAISILRHPKARMIASAGPNRFTASISLAFAVNCVRRRPARKLVHLYRLAAQQCPPPYPPPQAGEGREGVGETGRVRLIGGPACADISGPVSHAGGRRQESRSRTQLGPVPVRRAPAPGQST